MISTSFDETIFLLPAYFICIFLISSFSFCTDVLWPPQPHDSAPTLAPMYCAPTVLHKFRHLRLIIALHAQLPLCLLALRSLECPVTAQTARLALLLFVSLRLFFPAVPLKSPHYPISRPNSRTCTSV